MATAPCCGGGDWYRTLQDMEKHECMGTRDEQLWWDAASTGWPRVGHSSAVQDKMQLSIGVKRSVSSVVGTGHVPVYGEDIGEKPGGLHRLIWDEIHTSEYFFMACYTSHNTRHKMIPPKTHIRRYFKKFWRSIYYVDHILIYISLT